MKHFAILFKLILFSSLILLIDSCTKESLDQARSGNGKESLEIRDSTSLSNVPVVYNGMLKFNSYRDLATFEAALDQMTETDLSAWRNSFSVKTPAKGLEAYNAYTLDSFPQSIINDYAGLLRIRLDPDSTINVEGFSRQYDEFINPDHVFLVGTDLIKVTTTSLIIVQDGLTKPYQTYNENTVSSASGDVIVIDIRNGPCCPQNKSKEKQFSNNGHSKRITITRSPKLVLGFADGVYLANFFQMETKGESWIKRGIPKRWRTQRVPSQLTWDFHMYIDWPGSYPDVNEDYHLSNTNTEDRASNSQRVVWRGPSFQNAKQMNDYDPEETCYSNPVEIYTDHYNHQSITQGCTE